MALPRTFDVRPVGLRTAPAQRLAQLLAGLALYGFSMSMQIRATLGLDPWDVLHDALSRRSGLSFGTITAITGAIVLLGWWPLRQRPGIGTVCNVVVIAVTVDVGLAVLQTPDSLAGRLAFLVGGVVLNGVASAAYIGARLGPGPRDGLMTGLTGRTGWSIRIVRTAIEVTVLATGWLLGGSVGVGTVLYAVAIGPLVQAFLPLLAWRDRADTGRRAVDVS
jgi:uncharacterized membrane protein YczE